MDEIKVIVNITKHEWEYLNKLVENGDQLGHHERLIVNGTPLPKGHGRLIDGSALLNEIYNSEVYNDDYYYGIIYHLFEEAPTIIKADKEDDE